MDRLPRWVEYGAFILAFTAGFVNAVGLLGFEHQSVSHLSGTATQVGTATINKALPQILHLVAILVSFLLGASLSGYMLSGNSLRLGRHYDSLLVIEGFLLLVAIFVLQQKSGYGHYIASAACGLQNAMATTYSGAIVRTTHVTGIFTDLGIMLGAAAKGHTFDKRKALLFLLIIFGFILGGTLGAYCFIRYEFIALSVPAVICFLLAGSYRVYCIYRR